MKSITQSIKASVPLMLSMLLVLACNKEDFEYNIPEGNEIQVDSIGFSAGSPTLIADGQSALGFIIQAYSKKKVTLNGVTRDSMVLIPADRIPDSDKKVFDDTGKEVGLSFSTTASNPSVKSFYAKIGDKQSVTKQVTIKPAGAAYSKITIPVVIHVFELRKTDTKRYPWYNEVDHKKLQDLVSGLNAMFNRVGTADPNGAKANIEFVLAANAPDGRPLDKAGYNMFEYASTFNWGWGTYEAANLIKANSSKLLWNPKKYLNVWILPSAVFYFGITTSQPGYTLSSNSLPGLNLQQVASVNDVSLTEPESVGVMLGRDELYSALRGPAPNVGYRFGTFYGLFPTYTYDWDPTYSDHCDDTQNWTVDQYQKIYKLSAANVLFRAENVMDATFIDFSIEGGQYLVSRVNSFTADQVARIRYVVQNCPERMAWQ